MDESSWNQYLARKQAQQQRQPEPAPQSQPRLPEEEGEYWARVGRERSAENLERGFGKPTGFAAHYTPERLSEQQQQAKQHLAEVAKTDKGGVWRGARFAPGSRFAPTKDQLINGDEK